MFKTLQPLILASLSPRRKRLLRSVGIEFRIEPSEVEESGADGASAASATPAEAAQRWACLKARSVSASSPGSWVLGADTIVVLDGRVFGKPADRAEAARMLEALGGRVHEVITGICLTNGENKFLRSGSVATRVCFKPLTGAEIGSYIDTGEPMDKAGAYGIQGIGAFLVKSVEGSYTNVVGLPLCETVEWLTEAGIIEPANPAKMTSFEVRGPRSDC
ncbi:MAG: Maf family protein [Syntrophobacteraceae bacterium]